MFFFFFERIIPYIKYPQQVYHYTNSDAFLGILTNKDKKELWASHILFQNDKKEAYHAFDVLQDALNTNKQRLSNHGLNVEEILNSIKPLIGQNTFTVSFSEKRDDLNQWRSYANSKPSFCVGFSPIVLLKNEETKILIHKCIYKIDKQQEMINNLIDYAITKLSDSDSSEIAAQDFCNSIKLDFFAMSAIFKHPAFQEEKEWRLVITPKNDEINIRMGKNSFIPYIKVPFEDNALKDVIIGPCEDEDYMRKSTEFVCNQYGIKFDGTTARVLVNSKIPYRS